MPEEDVQGDAKQDLSPIEPQTLAAADDKWNEIMGDDGETFAEHLGITPAAETPPAEPTDDVVIEKQEPVADAIADASDAPQIDESLINLAISEGADKADLDELIKSDPARATELLTQLQEQYNAQTLTLLHGPASTEVKPNANAESASADTTDAVKSPLEALITDAEAKAAAVDQYGEDFVEKVLVPLAKRDVEIAKREAKLDAVIAQSEAAEQQATVAALEAAFVSFGAGYKDFYGAGVEALTPEQLENRVQVGREADRIRAGDIVRGNPDQGAAHYLTRAHHIVSAEQRQVAVRKELISQIKTRSKSTVAKPSRGTVDRIEAGEQSEAAAVQALDQRISNLGLGAFFDED